MLVAGCSFANGSGLPEEHLNPRIWANQLAAKIGCVSVHNIAKTGANNHWIFLETVSSLIQNSYDVVVIQWSAIPRYNFKAGLELYNTDTKLDAPSINLVGGDTISTSWLQETKNRLLRLHNDHWDILDLVKYVNVLIELQVNTRQKQIFFVNGLAPWPDNYFVKKAITLPCDLDRYIYDLLEADFRDDDEILQLYNMIHDDYTRYGGIQESFWLNLYQSQKQTKVDTVSDQDHHPGFASQDLFANMYYQIIQSKTQSQCPLQLS